MKKVLILTTLAALIGGFLLGKLFGDPNKYVSYGDTGLPRNCRAIITTNLNGYKFGEYTPSQALDSIDRNCGLNGYSWGLK